jgi:hypothetical protein
MAVDHDRRQHARERHARADRSPEGAALVHGDLAPVEVARDAEEGDREVFDVEAEVPEHEAAQAAAPQQRDEWKRVVAERVLLDEGPARLRADPGRFPFERAQRGEDRADVASAHPVDGDLRLFERAQHPHVGKAAGRAAPEDEAERLPGQHAREPREVAPLGPGAHVVDLVRGHGLEPAGGPRDLVARVEEHEQAPRGGLLSLAPGPGPRRGRLRGVRDEEQHVGLAPAHLRPGRAVRRGLEHEEAMARFLLVQPLGEGRLVAPFDRARVDAQDGIVRLERRREARREGRYAARLDDRQQRQVLEAARHAAPSGGAIPKPLRHLGREVQDERAVRGRQALKGLAIEAQEDAVADGAHPGAARGAREQRHLADAVSAPELAEEPRRSLRVAVAPDLEAPARDQEEGVGRIALPEEPGAAADRTRNSASSASTASGS